MSDGAILIRDSGNGESLSDVVVANLQRRILSGEIPIGTWLRHGALAEELGISRTPVREALRILAAQGLVTIAPNRGAQVNGQSGQDIREIGEVRAELEGFASELAADRMDDAQIKRMTGSWETFRESLGGSPSEQAEQWAVSNEEFHSVILEAARNPYLSLTINELRRRLPHNLSFAAYAGNSRLITRNLKEHEAIADAILSQDGPRARRLMAAHIRTSIDATARWVEQAAGETPGR
ncbi:GntR family transcriptional regulator [Dactylosporangium sp. NPDC000244]|uniref:GntR family transcriptional regulator n=1 Tax=Dactylosporangium sp. NPDC000244 TaxID=3154365 RepID=UPI00331DEE01